LGGMHPLAHQSESDLGRFGLGLKTASFAQSRCLTVATRQGGKTFVRRWYLDYIARPEVKDWRLLPDGRPGGRTLPCASLRDDLGDCHPVARPRSAYGGNRYVARIPPCFRNTLNVQANFQKTGRIKCSGIQPRIRILMAWARVRLPVPDRT